MPRVSINGTNQEFEVNEGEVLYDALYERGLTLPHGCLAGSCGACKVEVTLGHDQLEAPGAVENNTIEALKEEFSQSSGSDFVKDKVIRLSCRAKVRGDVSISPIK